MREGKSGFYWHCHHRQLVEWCYDYEERVEHIKEKPAHEVPERLRLFKEVKGKLPVALIKAGQKLDSMWGKVDGIGQELRDIWDKVDVIQRLGLAKFITEFSDLEGDLDGTRQKLGAEMEKVTKAEQKLGKARQKLDSMWGKVDKIIKDNMEKIEALHKKECPNCNWNGKEIIFKKEGK